MKEKSVIRVQAGSMTRTLRVNPFAVLSDLVIEIGATFNIPTQEAEEYGLIANPKTSQFLSPLLTLATAGIIDPYSSSSSSSSSSDESSHAPLILYARRVWYHFNPTSSLHLLLESDALIERVLSGRLPLGKTQVVRFTSSAFRLAHPGLAAKARTVAGREKVLAALAPGLLVPKVWRSRFKRDLSLIAAVAEMQTQLAEQDDDQVRTGLLNTFKSHPMFGTEVIPVRSSAPGGSGSVLGKFKKRYLGLSARGLMFLGPKDKNVECVFPLHDVMGVDAEDRKLAIDIKRSDPLLAVSSKAAEFAESIQLYLRIHANARAQAASGNVDRHALNPDLQKDLEIITTATTAATASSSSTTSSSTAETAAPGLGVPAPPAPKTGGGEKTITALYAHASSEEDELEFAAGDKIVVLAVFDDGWAEGMINGSVGVFPISYTTLSLEKDPSTFLSNGSNSNSNNDNNNNESAGQSTPTPDPATEAETVAVEDPEKQMNDADKVLQQVSVQLKAMSGLRSTYSTSSRAYADVTAEMSALIRTAEDALEELNAALEALGLAPHKSLGDTKYSFASLGGGTSGGESGNEEASAGQLQILGAQRDKYMSTVKQMEALLSLANTYEYGSPPHVATLEQAILLAPEANALLKKINADETRFGLELTPSAGAILTGLDDDDEWIQYGLVRYEYVAADTSEIDITPGQIVIILDDDEEGGEGVDDGWITVTSAPGTRGGFVPATHVDILDLDGGAEESGDLDNDWSLSSWLTVVDECSDWDALKAQVPSMLAKLNLPFFSPALGDVFRLASVCLPSWVVVFDNNGSKGVTSSLCLMVDDGEDSGGGEGGEDGEGDDDDGMDLDALAALTSALGGGLGGVDGEGGGDGGGNGGGNGEENGE